jgi:hypothetical protein
VIAAALEDTDWTQDAISTIVGIAANQELMTCDDLRREMRPAPHSGMYGAAFSAARNYGYIEPVGDQTSTSKSRRNGRLRTWRRKINEGAGNE